MEGTSPLEEALRNRAKRARELADSVVPPYSQEAAALRGKAKGFDESADLVKSLWGRK